MKQKFSIFLFSVIKLLNSCWQQISLSNHFFTLVFLLNCSYSLQLQSEPISKASPFSKYHGIRQAVSCIYREEGLFGFWKGHNPAQALSVIYGVVQVRNSNPYFSSGKECFLSLKPPGDRVYMI